MVNDKYKIILASASPRRKEIMEKLGVDFEIKVSGCEEKTDETEPGKVVVQLATAKALDVALKYAGIDNIVVGADTVVAHKGSIMGKPKDEEAAFDMIKSYADDVHKVYTGVCVVIPYNDEEDKARITETLRKFNTDSKEFFGIENLNVINYTLNKNEVSAENDIKCDSDNTSHKSNNCIKYGVITVAYSVYTDVHVVSMSDDEIRRYATSGEPLDKAGAYAIQGGFAPYISSIQGDYYNVVGLPACSLYALLKEL